ncbi:AMP-binding protein [Brevundimonas sp.]|uniref:AMP-binding protein n=1 Tax=Brevundimonas sp. TaxID=1871086 RepID=UPI003450E212
MRESKCVRRPTARNAGLRARKSPIATIFFRAANNRAIPVLCPDQLETTSYDAPASASHIFRISVWPNTYRHAVPPDSRLMFLEQVERHALERADHVALRWSQTSVELTYSELWSRTGERAMRLAALGLEGAPLLIFGANNPDAVISFIAAMRAGLAPSFMPLPAARFDDQAFWSGHAALFDHLGQGAVLAPQTAVDAIRQECPAISLTLLASEQIDSLAASPLPARPAGTAVALLQHSSGTTGLKKGVPLSYRAIDVQLRAYAEAVEFDGDSIIASWLPLYHDMGLIACLMLPLTFGAEVNFIDPFYWTANPQSLFEVIEQRRATHVWLPNFAFRHLERAVRRTNRIWALGSVKAWVNCSEPCKADAFAAFLTRYAEHGVTAGSLTCCYAMAETVFAVTQSPPGTPVTIRHVAAIGLGEIGETVAPCSPGEAAASVLGCGRAIPGCQIRIRDADGQDGVYGEIEVAAEFLFDGYFRAPERTSLALQNGWYRTADIGFIDSGELFVCGRLDDRIIVGGRNLYAHQIEQLTADVPGVTPGRVVAMGVHHPESGSERLVIAAEISGESDAIAKMIIQTLDASLGLRPADVRLFSDRRIIKTTSGKVDRKRNRERYLSGGFA